MEEIFSFQKVKNLFSRMMSLILILDYITRHYKINYLGKKISSRNNTDLLRINNDILTCYFLNKETGI